jgi:hypothetical protein
MPRLTPAELDALEAAHKAATPGDVRLLPNGGAGMDEDPTYWGILGGEGYYDGPGSGGFNLSGFIGEAEARRLVLSYNALPALLAAARLTVPEVIGEKHRDGNWWMVWEPDYEQWFKCRWMMGRWRISGTVSDRLYGTPTHALPMLPAPEAPDATPR